ncbi:MAG: DNA-binding protein [Deltaproteobacteria bacterium]|nr:DNA-binding protein [Deltaproteobacteria bacterium]
MTLLSLDLAVTQDWQKSRLFSWRFFSFALTVFFLLSSCSSAPPDTIAIATARGLPPGAEVVVRGFVTVPSGLFASFTGEQGFALEDSTGGIYVSLELAINLQLGQEVRVTGQLAEIAKLRVISSRSESVKQLSRQAVVQPNDITTGAVSAATEGHLVRIHGTLTRSVGDDRPYGYKIFLDDGSGETLVFVPVSTGIDPLALPGLQAGQRLTVVGFSGRFNDTYEVVPRFSEDLAVASP